MHCLIFLLVSPLKIRKHIWVKLAQSLQKTFRRLFCKVLHHLVLLSLCHSCSDHLHLHMPTQSEKKCFGVKLTKVYVKSHHWCCVSLTQSLQFIYFFYHFIQFRVMAGLGPIPAVRGREAGYSLYRSPVCHKVNTEMLTFTPTANLTCM